MSVPAIPSITTQASSSAANAGDTFFGPINYSRNPEQGQAVSIVEKIVLPVTISIVSGVFVYVLTRSGVKK